jgi:hypothetical protein
VILGTYGLLSVLGEEVGGDEGALHALVEAGPAVVGSVNDGILEATGVLEVQVESAVLGLVGTRVAGTNEGLELIETIGDDLLTVINKVHLYLGMLTRAELTVLSGEVLVETEP